MNFIVIICHDSIRNNMQNTEAYAGVFMFVAFPEQWFGLVCAGLKFIIMPGPEDGMFCLEDHLESC